MNQRQSYHVLFIGFAFAATLFSCASRKPDTASVNSKLQLDAPDSACEKDGYWHPTYMEPVQLQGSEEWLSGDWSAQGVDGGVRLPFLKSASLLLRIPSK